MPDQPCPQANGAQRSHHSCSCPMRTHHCSLPHPDAPLLPPLPRPHGMSPSDGCSSADLSLAPSAWPSAFCRACCRLSLWHTSKAWPTVRTTRMAWLCRAHTPSALSWGPRAAPPPPGAPPGSGHECGTPHLLLGFEDVAPEGVVGTVPSDVTEYFQVL